MLRPFTVLAILGGSLSLAGCEGRPDRSAFAGAAAGGAAGNRLTSISNGNNSMSVAAGTSGGAAIGSAIGADGARRSMAPQTGQSTTAARPANDQESVTQ